jgi:hypothetical protein
MDIWNIYYRVRGCAIDQSRRMIRGEDYINKHFYADEKQPEPRRRLQFNDTAQLEIYRLHSAPDAPRPRKIVLSGTKFF